MTKTFVISDTHFQHNNIIKYCDRPFKDAQQMDEILIKNWNNTVSQDDKVIHVGDFSFGNSENAIKIAERLNGKIILIKGNHDSKKFLKAYNDCLKFEEILPKMQLKITDDLMVGISHFPTDPWDIPHVHGHIHNRILNDPTKFNASVEVNNYTPIPLERIHEYFSSSR